jgi:hypothetical protein
MVDAARASVADAGGRIDRWITPAPPHQNTWLIPNQSTGPPRTPMGWAISELSSI